MTSTTTFGRASIIGAIVLGLLSGLTACDRNDGAAVTSTVTLEEEFGVSAWSAEDRALMDAMYRRQRARNDVIWAQIEALGVEPGAKLRLDFFFDAPNESSAVAMQAYLEPMAEGEVVLGYYSDTAKCSLMGTTPPAPVSAEMIDRWTERLCAAAVANGGSFRGWGAVVSR